MTKVLNSMRGTMPLKAGLLAAAIALGGCAGIQNMDRDNKVGAGAVVGAVVGGLIGYELLGGGSGQFIGLALGAGAGAVGGYYAADYLTRLDRRAMEETTYATLTDAPVGVARGWENDSSGNTGEVRAIRTFLSVDGQLCRDFANVTVVQGERVEAFHTACRNGAGAWIIT